MNNYIKFGIVLLIGVVGFFLGWQLASKKALEKELALSTEIIQTHIKSEEVKETIDKAFQERLSQLRPQITTINKEIQREIYKEPVYTDCKSTDGVVRNYERKLDLQTK